MHPPAEVLVEDMLATAVVPRVVPFEVAVRSVITQRCLPPLFREEEEERSVDSSQGHYHPKVPVRRLLRARRPMRRSAVPKPAVRLALQPDLEAKPLQVLQVLVAKGMSGHQGPKLLSPE